MGRAQDLILFPGQKLVGECLEWREGVGTGIDVSDAPIAGSDHKHVEAFAPLSECEAFCAGDADVFQRT